mgnify:CR=1 FL=1
MIKEYIQMISTHSSLIIKEAVNSWNGIDFSKHEPEIIKDYLLTPGIGVDYLNQKIASVISASSPYEIKFASVYCHQKPRITRTVNSVSRCAGSTLSCELGDLMTIFLLLDRDKNVIASTAKIMQAKKIDVLDSESQKCLYESDLEFEMPANLIEHSTCSNPIRTLPDYHEDRDKALSYLILNSGSPQNKEIPSSSNLSYHWSYHMQLTMEFKTGLTFLKPLDATENGWNCIINDLINIGTGKIPSTRNRGLGLDYVIDAFNDYTYYPEYKQNFPDGIPKLIIICKDKERQVSTE